MSVRDGDRRFVDMNSPRLGPVPALPKMAKAPRGPWSGVVGEIVKMASPSYQEVATEQRFHHEYRSSGALNVIAGLRKRELTERARIDVLNRSENSRGTSARRAVDAEVLRREVELRLTELGTNDVEREYVAHGILEGRRDLPSRAEDEAWFDRELPAMAKVSPIAAQMKSADARPTYGDLRLAQNEVKHRRNVRTRFPELAGVTLDSGSGIAPYADLNAVDTSPALGD